MTSFASRVPRLVSALLAIALSGAPVLSAQNLSPGSASVFRQFGNRVVKIEISENGSAAKASLGSGFYVSAEGDVITNYHVMSQVVHDPDRYDARIITAAGDTLGVTLLAIDVVHDLALV
ncbi:MAG TPA: trypsin-like peptidase domain-containing protein, partial [Gemmatimonadales bacterium]|nr:trypsin-like peptidase domain-containing protein [Gemmatimonadales bacterium]